MLIYLMNEMGLYTGESFRSWDEVDQWVYDRLGHYPTRQMKADMRGNRSFQIGSHFFKCELAEMSKHSYALVG